MARPELGDVVLLAVYYSENESLPAGAKFHKIMQDVDNLVNLERYLGHVLRFRKYASGVWCARLEYTITDEIEWGFLDRKDNKLVISDGAERVVHKYIRDYPDLAKEINRAMRELRL